MKDVCGKTVAYVPHVLRNMREICQQMGVGEKVVRRWVAEGAPIAVEGHVKHTRYSAEKARLQLWREMANRSCLAHVLIGGARAGADGAGAE